MPNRHDDNDGSDIFRPGYVDATTNLILNLLFLLTILIVAVFMFALELGRTSKAEPENPPVTSNSLEMEVVAPVATGPLTAVSTATTDFSKAIAAATTDFSSSVAAATDGPVAAVPAATVDFSATVAEASTVFSRSVALLMADSVQENMALKSEVQRLNALLAQQISPERQAGGAVKTIDASSSMPKPLHGVDKTLASDFEVIVRFKDEAVTFTSAEHDQLLESLQSIDINRKASIYVEVPAGFSEAKRMGFYRAMAVRNLLIEMKLPQENIDVSVVEGTNKPNASLVRVRSH